MAAPGGSSNPTNPLCTDERLSKLYEMGKRYDTIYGHLCTVDKGGYAGWDTQLASLRAGAIRSEGYIGYSCSAQGLALLADAVAAQLGFLEGGSPIGKQLEDIREAHRRDFQQLISGAAPEFNDLIGRIVEQKVNEALPRQAGSSTDVDDQPVQRAPRRTTEEKIEQAKIAIDQQVAELDDLVVPGLVSDEGRVKTKILNKSVEVRTLIRNSAVDAQERNRRLHVWIAYLIKKNGQRLSQVPVPRGPFWEVIERMRQSANILIYNLEKLG